MNKTEFLKNLREGLNGLPEDEVDGRIDFYSEMIDERIEEGASEDDAVAALGSIDEIAMQILSDIPLSSIVKKKAKIKRGMSPLTVVLLAVGSPIWLSLLIAAFAVAVSLYASLWAVIISLWAVDLSLAACAVASIPVGIYFIAGINPLTGFSLICASFVLAGLSIFLFFGCRASTKLSARIVKRCVLGIKKSFVRKERTK